MGRKRSRGREKRRSGSRNRKQRKSRRSYDHSSDRSRHDSNYRHRTSQDGLRVPDGSDSSSTEGHRSRSRHRRDSYNRDRSRSKPRNRSRSRSHTVRPTKERTVHTNSEILPTVATPVLPGTSQRQHSIESYAPGSEASTLANALMQAIKTMQPVRSKHYYVSNFDPSINNIEAWCEEVDRAREANGWSDHECLSRVASCLKGDARVWLGEWVTNDRTWTNFKLEFKPLCPSKLDYANILFEAMNTTSDKYSGYAEYARRTLLRLKIVQGLSGDLRTLIVIRGIENPQVRAAAANADLTPETIVSFLSIYTKPSSGKHDKVVDSKTHGQVKPSNRSGPKCFSCNQHGHVSRNCRQSTTNTTVGEVDSNTPVSTQPSSGISCTFCKKQGHTEDKCYTKAKSRAT